MTEATTPPVSLDRQSAAQVRARRERLRAAEERLASAASVPSPGRLDLWWVGVANAVEALTVMFAEHVHDTEGRDGLFAEVSAAAPRLENEVDRLRSEHRRIDHQLDELAKIGRPSTDEDVRSIREQILDVLSLLAGHRFAGSDLLYRAYHVDIGAVD